MTMMTGCREGRRDRTGVHSLGFRSLWCVSQASSDSLECAAHRGPLLVGRRPIMSELLWACCFKAHAAACACVAIARVVTPFFSLFSCFLVFFFLVVVVLE